MRAHESIIGYTFPRGQGCRAIYEDQAGEQYVLDDEGRRIYGVYLIPEAECLRSAASTTDPVIGKRLFVDGIERDVYRDEQGQYVIGPDGERVYGVWVLTDDVWDEILGVNLKGTFYCCRAALPLLQERTDMTEQEWRAELSGNLMAGVCLYTSLLFDDATAIVACFVCLKFFADWAQPTGWASVTDMGGTNAASLFALVNTAGSLAGFVAGPVMGKTIDYFGSGAPSDPTGWTALFIGIGVVYVLSALSWLFIDCTKTIE